MAHCVCSWHMPTQAKPVVACTLMANKLAHMLICFVHTPYGLCLTCLWHVHPKLALFHVMACGQTFHKPPLKTVVHTATMWPVLGYIRSL